jgi:hypothetical protein
VKIRYKKPARLRVGQAASKSSNFQNLNYSLLTGSKLSGYADTGSIPLIDNNFSDCLGTSYRSSTEIVQQGTAGTRRIIVAHILITAPGLSRALVVVMIFVVIRLPAAEPNPNLVAFVGVETASSMLTRRRPSRR